MTTIFKKEVSQVCPRCGKPNLCQNKQGENTGTFNCWCQEKTFKPTQKEKSSHQCLCFECSEESRK